MSHRSGTSHSSPEFGLDYPLVRGGVGAKGGQWSSWSSPGTKQKCRQCTFTPHSPFRAACGLQGAVNFLQSGLHEVGGAVSISRGN